MTGCSPLAACWGAAYNQCGSDRRQTGATRPGAVAYCTRRSSDGGDWGGGRSRELGLLRRRRVRGRACVVAECCWMRAADRKPQAISAEIHAGWVAARWKTPERPTPRGLECNPASSNWSPPTCGRRQRRQRPHRRGNCRASTFGSPNRNMRRNESRLQSTTPHDGKHVGASE